MPSDDRRHPTPSQESSAGAFGALLSAAAREPTAARGLALAYAALPPGHRKQLVDAVVIDAHAEGMCPSLVLASLLSVEENRSVAEYIMEAMKSLETSEVSNAAQVRAFVAGDEQAGAMLIVRPLHGTFVEALGLAWDEPNGITRSLFEPLVHHKQAHQLLLDLPCEMHFEEMPLSFAIDVVAGPLWRHRRKCGSVPSEVERFADLFSFPDFHRQSSE